MFLKLGKKQKQNKKPGFQHTLFEFTGIPAFTKVLFHTNSVHSTFPSNDPELQFCFLAKTNISLTSFFFVFLFFNFTQRPWPEVAVSVDTGGSPVRCGSALCRTHWRQAGGQRWAVLLVPRTKPSAGWGLRNCGRRLSGPGRTLGWTTHDRGKRRILMSTYLDRFRDKPCCFTSIN